MSISEDTQELIARYGSEPDHTADRRALDKVNAENAKMMADAAAFREAQQKAREGHSIEWKVADRGGITFSNGAVAAHSYEHASATAQSSRNPDRVTVRIGNYVTETSRANAEQQGLEIVEPGASSPGTSQRPLQPASEHDTPAATDAVSVAAEQVIEQAREVYGAAETHHVMLDIAQSGNVYDHLPPGISRPAADAIVSSYTKRAESVLAPTGANVAMLTQQLSNHELMAARVAVVNSDWNALRELGSKAHSRSQSRQR